MRPWATDHQRCDKGHKERQNRREQGRLKGHSNPMHLAELLFLSPTSRPCILAFLWSFIPDKAMRCLLVLLLVVLISPMCNAQCDWLAKFAAFRAASGRSGGSSRRRE